MRHPNRELKIACQSSSLVLHRDGGVQNDHQVHHHLHRMPGAFAPVSSRTWAKMIALVPKAALWGSGDPAGVLRCPVLQFNPYLALHVQSHMSGM